MARLFVGGAGSTDQVNIGSAAALDDITAGTYIFVLKLGTAAATMRLSRKGSSFVVSVTATGTTLQFFIARATTSLLASALLSACANWPGAGAWAYVAFDWNDAGADGDQQIYVGSLTAPFLEASSYTIQRVGVGARTTDAADDITLGGGPTTQSFDGDIATVALFGTRLTQAEKESWQRLPRPVVGSARALAFYEFGLTGTGNEVDLTFNGNTGTPTGTTQSAHVPGGSWRSRALAS